MGLAERKVKQRIGLDPRNLTWSNDTNRFSFKHMTALGWDESKGIGKSGDGMATHIAVARKTDNTGIGMGRIMRETGEMSAGAGQAGAGLEDVLRRLASRAGSSASASPAPSAAPSPAPASPAPSSAPASIRNKMASRQKHLNSKRLASQSPAALAEILGVSASSLPATPSASTPAASVSASAALTPATSGTSTPVLDERDSDETVVKSSISVGDYFRQKLREKAAARQAAREAAGIAGPAPTMSEGSLALVKDAPKVAIGGVAWEGNKMQFEDVHTDIADLGGEETHAGLGSAEEKKEHKEHDRVLGEGADKKSKSKEKKDKKDKKDKEASADSTSDDVKRKEEKKAKKAEKETKKAEKEAKKADKEAKKAAKEARKADKKDKKRKRDDDDSDDSGKKRKSKSE